MNQPQHNAERAKRRPAYEVRQLLNRFQWLHQGIGVLGGFTFFIGSIFFLYDEPVRMIGTWLFIIGSAGMLIGNLGSVVVKYRIDGSDDHRPALSEECSEPIG